MRSWNKPDGTPNNKERLEGMKLFEENIKTIPGEAGLCKGNPVRTKEKFIEWGEFHRADEDPPPPPGAAIPADTVFHFWESSDTNPNHPERAERDKEVVLIVDIKNPPVGPEPMADAQVWRCTYTPYRTTTIATDN
ncbi:MAG: hypothetical protein QOD12_220 [Verrucomicrobiota bacterium]|jgi:hypothetical protein